MQEGGSVGSSSQAFGFLDYVPYVSQTPVQPTVSTSTKGNTTSQAESILSDDMIKALLGKGLTNDVNAFLQDVQSMFSGIEMQNPFGSSINSHSLAMKQMALIAKINQIQNNKAAFDKSVDKARETGALDEIAVTSYGRILARDAKTGSISQINPDQLYEKRDKYIPLTNAELASLRMNNPNLAFDTNIFQTLENAVSSKEIDDFIRKAINEADKTTTNEFNRFIPGSQLKDVQKGLELLQSGIIEEKIENSDNINQINAATEYLFRIMPTNYRNFLYAKSAANGVDPKEGIFDLIKTYANAKVTSTKKNEISYPKSLNDDGSDSGSKGLVETDITEWMASGTALHPDSLKTFTFNNNTNYKITSERSPYYNNVKDLKGNPLAPIVTLNTLFTDTNLSSFLDKAGVSVGTQIASPTDFSKIAVNTTEGYTMALMPVKEVNGRKVVDLDVSLRLEEAEEAIRNLGSGVSELEKKKIYKEKQVEDYITKTNAELYAEGKLAPFLVASGYASDNNFIKDNKAADLENDAAMTASIENAINEDRAAHNLESIDFSSGLFNFRMFGENIGDTNMYKVSIFIPYSSGSVSEALLANNHLFASKKNRTAGNVFQIDGEQIKTNF